MAKATRQMHHNEEHYVAKMNFRSEKILQSQIERLNKEKLLQVKSLNSQRRVYERKLQKINDRVLEVEKLSRNFDDSSQRLPTREHFNKLSNDATRQRHMATGVGYSYIDQLLGASRPLVNRPLRWGINPSLPSLQQQSSKPITFATDAAASLATSKTFLTEIKGQPIYIRPREAVFLKRQRPTALVLPPIDLSSNHKEVKSHKLETNEIPLDFLSERASSKTTETRELENQNDEVINQDANSQLPPILECEIEETVEIPKGKNEKKSDKEMNEKRDNTEEKLIGPEASNMIAKPDVVLENSKTSPDIEMRAMSSSSLGGHFTTEYEFPTNVVERFTRSSEMLNIESGDQQTEEHRRDSKPNSFRYQLHARRFSL